MYVHFRKRFSLNQLAEINEVIAQSQGQNQDKEASSSDDNDENPTGGNCGKLLIDATCAPADL